MSDAGSDDGQTTCDLESLVVIRRCDPADLDDVTDLRERVLDRDGIDPFVQDPSVVQDCSVVGHDLSCSFVAVAVGGEAIVGYAGAHPVRERTWSLGVAVEPASRGTGIAGRLVDAIRRDGDANGVERFEAWAPVITPATECLGYLTGAILDRRLMQLGADAALPGEDRRLPRGYSLAPLRDDDLACVVAVNARAFARHPEQSTMSVGDVVAARDEPWWDRDGFIVLRDTVDDAVVGFCWTKIVDGQPGEIYVFCVDPDSAGRGLGRVLALAGLDHIAKYREKAMLYVDEANLAGRRLYAALGFHLVRVAGRYVSPGVGSA